MWYAAAQPHRWIRGMRYRERPVLDYARLRGYRDVSTTSRLTADYILPGGLRPLARVTVTGLEYLPLTGPLMPGALFPQGMISKNLDTTCEAAGLLALYSGAPVVPVAIRGTDDIHLSSMFTGRVNVCIRFGTPLTFSRGGAKTPRSRLVSDDILSHIRGLLAD